MSDNKEDFALHCPVKNEEARKRLGIKAGFFWTTAKKLSVAVSRCIAAMDDKGYDEDDFKKPVRVNLPAIGDLPPEGVFDTEFCNRYEKGGEDGKTMMLIPGAVPADQFHGEAVENTTVINDTPVTDTEADSDDSAGAPLPAYAYNVNGELMSDVEKDMTQSVSGKSFAVRFRANWKQPQCVTDVATWQLQEINVELMAPTGYMADIELALSDKEIASRLDKLEMRDVHCYTRDIEKVFPENKRPGIQHVREFTKAWLDTDYIDRGLLVKEWQKGNRVSCINRTPSGANAGGGIQSDRKMPQTILGLEFEIALGLLARKYEFDIYSLPLEIELKANTIMNAVDDPEWLATRELFVSMPGGLDYSRACVIATVKTTPENLYESPFRHREHLNKVLTETDHATPDPLVVNIACGRSSLPMPMKGSTNDDEEKPQSAGAMADEPAASEAVEQDTTEHHPDPQQVETESSVAVADDGEQALREKFGEQLAAERGDFVPGISDPNDPKWVHNDYSASNEGEKTEVATDATDSVDHSEAFSNQHEPETSHSEPAADQNEPETPQTEPVPRVPDDIQPGIYFDIANEAYHAGPGVSKSQLDDIADIPAIYLWRKNAPVDTEKTKPLDIGTAFHCCTLEPDEFSNRFIIAPEFNRRTNDGKQEEKAFRESCVSSGKTIITAEEGRKLDLMRQSIMALPMGKWLLESVGFCESSIYWEDTETGLLCRCRPDKIIPEYNWIVDVKTTADIHKFKTAFYDYRYHVQDAFYSDGYRAEFGEIPTFVFLVASTTIECGRYPVEIFMMGDEAKLAGQHEYHRNLKTLAECTRNNDWPTIKTLNLPRWAKENVNV
ncbi:PD-(D/E)XK nuclease-like domain-containing protein [Salmonella enterica subsp. diarizonae serovar 16:z10:e,n,x,z15]|uniref:PD-(D/E)XK nuclease-like domain-containing protein n=1 Tax=Salmonella enterica TaxID=28901 RepID=UPI0018022F69|nr:PD-(D/E)XK nuclease-like domain-containing protein [Salmonella enterica subsp. diarizonae serovar 16:z10:e,n,x,z15]MCH5506889.1 PD-(D/E)XK nuclease-like domain-containing protein [Salmonella enterica subsp. diarizonae serovar 16:z10:e,n,x,z15]HAG2476957.1 exonuclease VIII [Salmonella enterica]